MSMSDHEWVTVANALRALPAQEKWTPALDETYRSMLVGLTHQEAMGALGRYAMTGGTFRPTWAELLRLAAGTERPAADFASPEVAWQLVQSEIRRLGGSTHDPGFADRHQAAIDRLREVDECVAAWAAQRGLRGPGSLGTEEVHHPQYGGAVTKRLAGDYSSARDLAVERIQLGHHAFPERAFLVRHTGGTGGLAQLLDRLRPEARPELEAGEAA